MRILTLEELKEKIRTIPLELLGDQKFGMILPDDFSVQPEEYMQFIHQEVLRMQAETERETGLPPLYRID